MLQTRSEPEKTPPVSDRLDGRVAVVTGSTRGIGRATAVRLAHAGAHVVISSRKPDACESAVLQMREMGLSASACACHVGDPDQRQRLIEHADKVAGGLDILVASAAINPVFDALDQTDEGVWTRILDTNLTATWALAKAAAPAMAARGGGSMVMVSSIAGLMAAPHAGAYGVSKAAANQLVRQFAFELADRGIRVNAVAPGATRTDMIRSILADPDRTAAMAGSIPLGRIADPDDIAAAIVFLASDLARHITGQIVAVDGGQSLAAA